MEGRVKSHSLTLMHKTVKKVAPKYLTDKLSYRLDIHNHNTRQRNTLNIQRLHTARKNNTFFVKTVRDYNILTGNGTVTSQDSISSFKSKTTRNLKLIQFLG